jgi:hypothetical protein
VPLNKFVSIATDGAPAVLGKKIGLIGLLGMILKFHNSYPFTA